MNRLCKSVWRYPEYDSWRQVRLNVWLFIRRFKWAWERATKGYCEIDLINFDTHISGLLHDMLLDFDKNRMGLLSSPSTGVLSDEESSIVLHRMAELFGRSMYEENYPDPYYEKWRDSGYADEEIKALWWEQMQENSELMEADRDEAFELLRKYFFHLWI